MNRIGTIVRNFICGAIAVGVIATGKARRARQIALRGDVITPIYFHNPNKRLFARCIGWLARHGYTFISTQELIDILHHGKAIPRGAVWLSFDDGYKEWLEDVLPLVRDRHVPVTLFIPSGIVKNDGRLPWLHRDAAEGSGVRDAVNVSELKSIAAYPEVTIGAHTVNHVVTANLAEEKTRLELGESQRALESLTGSTVKCFAYPEGRFDGRERKFLTEFGYRLAAATTVGFITRKSDPYVLPRFCVSDEIWFPEAICNMVGVWRPAIDPIMHFLGAQNKAAPPPTIQPVAIEQACNRQQSA